MGRGQPIYAMSLQAEPYQGEVPSNFHHPTVESLVYPFDLRIEQGLTNLEDYRMMADVMMLRNGIVQDMELNDQLLQLEEVEAQTIT
jgi:hypothetical protein